MLVSRGNGLRFGIAFAILLGSLWFALGAAAKDGLRLSISQSRPDVGEPVSATIRTGPVGTGPCRMRLVAVAPGVNRYHALDAFINGGYSVMGPSGFSFHRLRPTPRLGFLARLRRTSPTQWRATATFPRRGRWQLIVPNWCAPGYASPPPAVRVIAVR
jgi:hypothetical protein